MTNPVLDYYKRGMLTMPEGQNLIDSEIRSLEVRKNLLKVVGGLIVHTNIFKKLGYKQDENLADRLFTDVCPN